MKLPIQSEPINRYGVLVPFIQKSNSGIVGIAPSFTCDKDCVGVIGGCIVASLFAGPGAPGALAACVTAAAPNCAICLAENTNYGGGRIKEPPGKGEQCVDARGRRLC
jgi:hypothetical protein